MMINYLLGIVSGICMYKVFKIINLYVYKRHCKRHVYKCSLPEELENAIKEIVEDMKQGKNNE